MHIELVDVQRYVLLEQSMRSIKMWKTYYLNKVEGT